MANLNLNKTILGGRIATDMELKQTQSGVPVCQFQLAVNRRFSKEGEQNTDFISIVAWKNTAEFISKYFRKGSSICIVGSIQKRNWTDNNGQKRYTTEVIADEAMFVDSKNDGGTAQQTVTNEPKFEEVNAEEDGLPF